MRTDSATMDFRVPFAASSVGVARKKLRSWMSAQHLPVERVEEARVVLSELIGNAVRHARPLSDGTLLVAWSLDGGALRLSVTDGGGRGRPHTVHAAPNAVSGRGMLIVDTLADSWWVDQSGSRTTVQALLRLR
ncbi:MAG TPA: ATP-binding protein [Nocardioidaceae bacterium]|nr:ATP-binding protein [Nocardioidaceae bacterium]